jgi:hypothetical protein
MINLDYDIFKRDAFGSRAWVESTPDLEGAKRRILELSADSPGKYVVVSRASGQMVGGGTTVTSGSPSTHEREVDNNKHQVAKRKHPNVRGASSTREDSSHAVPSHEDAESETLWR